MRRIFPFEFLSRNRYTPTSHNGFPYNQSRTFCLTVSQRQCITNSYRIGSIYFHDIPIPRPILRSSIFIGYRICISRKLYVVTIIEHNQIMQSQESGQTTCTLRNLLLNTSIGNKRINFMTTPFAETSSHKTLGDSSADSHRMSLTQRSRSILNTMHYIDFGVAGSYTAPLTKRLQIVHRIKPRHSQYTIKHRGHVPGI